MVGRDASRRAGYKGRTVMAEPLADQVMRKIKQAAELYHRLMLVVAPAGAGKTTALTYVKERIGAPLVNVNLELSRRMLELTERQRALQLPRLLREIVDDAASDLPAEAPARAASSAAGGSAQAGVVLLDNLEILFDVSLQQDPLRLLQGLSRNKTVVAAWNGSIDKDHMTYAVPDHPEYRRYLVRDFLVASPDLPAGRQG